MNYTIHNQDCLVSMAAMEANSIDAIVTDPPYHLTTGKKGGTGIASVNLESPYGRARVTTGFMGKSWDGGDIAHDPTTWREAIRVAKPGAHLLAFGGTRTFHRLACAIEDAGWEMRDTLMWLYGQGFPKSLDVSKAIDKEAGAKREAIGSNGNGRPNRAGARSNSLAQPQTEGGIVTAPATDAARQWSGWGTALKPAWEPIIMARKPIEGTVARNVQTYGTGAINVDGCRIPIADGDGWDVPAPDTRKINPARSGTANGTPTVGRRDGMRHTPSGGRWPANVVHDGSDEVVEGFPEVRPCGNVKLTRRSEGKDAHVYNGGRGPVNNLDLAKYNDGGGSASRFFYCAKASRADREDGNAHPTVKPTALMQWLVRMVTPPNGVVLDPFMGSGSTGKAAMLEGMWFVGCELDADYAKIAEARIAHAYREAFPLASCGG